MRKLTPLSYFKKNIWFKIQIINHMIIKIFSIYNCYILPYVRIDIHSTKNGPYN